jgi:hypothetical protein
MVFTGMVCFFIMQEVTKIISDIPMYWAFLFEHIWKMTGYHLPMVLYGSLGCGLAIINLLMVSV